MNKEIPHKIIIVTVVSCPSPPFLKINYVLKEMFP